MMTENVPNLEKETDMETQETQSSKHDESKETHIETHYSFPGKSKLKEFINTRSLLQEMLKVISEPGVPGWLNW